MIEIGGKRFIDSKYTYYVGYYFDRTKTLSSINQVSDFEQLNYWEFPDMATAQEYISLCMDMIDSEDGRMLFQITEVPIEQSTRYTNLLPIEFNYN